MIAAIYDLSVSHEAKYEAKNWQLETVCESRQPMSGCGARRGLLWLFACLERKGDEGETNSPSGSPASKESLLEARPTNP